MSGLARWLRDYLVSFPLLIKQYHIGVVVVEIAIDYLEPFGFFHADGFEVRTAVRVRGGGSLLEGDVAFCTDRSQVARALHLLRPVLLGEDASLAARPGKMPDELLSRFQPEEIELSSPGRPVRRLAKHIEELGAFLAEGRAPFIFHRHLCEVADQWSYIEIPGLIAMGRERLALEQGERVPKLRNCLTQSLQRVNIELSRPYFLFDSGVVETRAYLLDEEIFLIHRLQPPEGQGKLHGIAVEQLH